MECSDCIPEKYEYLFEEYEQPDFEPEVVCAVDVADTRLLGDKLSVYADRVELLHRSSRLQYGVCPVPAAGCGKRGHSGADSGPPAGMGDETRPDDRGMPVYRHRHRHRCFKYSNTTAATHRAAAELMDVGIRAELINRTMFDVKSRPRVELERLALDSMRFYFDGRCAMMLITNDMVAHAAAGKTIWRGWRRSPGRSRGLGRRHLTGKGGRRL